MIDGVLPTFMGVSSLSASQVILTMIGFTALYGILAVIEVMLMVRAIRQGPVASGPTAQTVPGSAAHAPNAAIPAPLYDQ